MHVLKVKRNFKSLDLHDFVGFSGSTESKPFSKVT